MMTDRSAPLEHNAGRASEDLLQMLQSAAEIARGMQRIGGDSPELRLACDKMLPAPLSVMVVGQVKVGKSKFLNGLTGRGGMLPSDVNPLTTVVTNLHFNIGPARQSGVRFCFHDRAQWQRLTQIEEGDTTSEKLRIYIDDLKDRVIRRHGAEFENLLGKVHDFETVRTDLLQQYVSSDAGNNAQGPVHYDDLVREADVYFDAAPFPCPVTLTDTPGINDPELIRDEITWQAIGNADYYLVILSAHQAMSQVDERLLKALQAKGSGRAIVFINRIDELNDCNADGLLLRRSVRADLGEIFGGDPGAVLAGSALWADYAATGQEQGVDHEQVMSWIKANPSLSRRLKKGLQANRHHELNAANEEEAILRFRALIASGMPDLRRFLSGVLKNRLSEDDVHQGISDLLDVAHAQAATPDEVQKVQLPPVEKQIDDLAAYLEEEQAVLTLQINDAFDTLGEQISRGGTPDVSAGASDQSDAEVKLPPQLEHLRDVFVQGVHVIKQDVVTGLRQIAQDVPDLLDGLPSTPLFNINAGLVHRFTPDTKALWREAAAMQKSNWASRIFHKKAATPSVNQVSAELVDDARNALLSQSDIVLKHYMAALTGYVHEHQTGAGLSQAAHDISSNSGGIDDRQIGDFAAKLQDLCQINSDETQKEAGRNP